MGRKETYQVRGNQLSQGRPWSDKEIETVKRLAGTIKTKTIARKINRSYESLRQMAKRKGIRFVRRDPS